MIDNQKGGGGTQLSQALRHAFSLPHTDNISRSIVVVSDGYISAEREAFTLIREGLNNANVFAFGIGSSVNRYLIEGLAVAGRGEPFIVTKPNEAAKVAAKLRTYIESPVLTGIAVSFDGFEAYDLEPKSIPDLMAMRPIQIMGKWKGSPEGTVTLKGFRGDGEYARTFDVTGIAPKEAHRALRYLWARSRIATLSDFGDARSRGARYLGFSGAATDDELVRAVTSLGLTYDLLTRYTSFVAVHEVVRNPEKDSQDVTQPLPLPQGVTDLAVGDAAASQYASTIRASGASQSVPEPELLALLVMLAAIVAGVFAWSHGRQPAGRTG